MNFNNIIHPLTNEKLSIFSFAGKQLLKHYIKMYKEGGATNNTMYSQGITQGQKRCQTCDLFRRCDRYAVVLDLTAYLGATR